MQFPDSDFWDFSTRYYAEPQVESTCLQLQDNYDFNINLLLFIYWLSFQKHKQLNKDQWQEVYQATLSYQEIILPLRASRQLIKTSSIAWPEDFLSNTRNNIGEIELHAEHLQQIAIEQKYLSFEKQLSTEHDKTNINSLIMDNFENYLAVIQHPENSKQLEIEFAALTVLMTQVQENIKISA